MTNIESFIADKLFRKRLSNARKSLHLTQSQVAEKSGLSTSTISSIENIDGVTSPTLRSLIKYASAIGISIDIRFNEED